GGPGAGGGAAGAREARTRALQVPARGGVRARASPHRNGQAAARRAARTRASTEGDHELTAVTFAVSPAVPRSFREAAFHGPAGRRPREIPGHPGYRGRA